jgi:hypothetical protein
LQIFARNDFENNYQPFESVRLGANHKPYFHLVDGELKLELFPYDPEKAPPVTESEKAPVPPPGPLTPVGEWLHRHSHFYRWFDPRIRLMAPHFAATLSRWGVIKPGEEIQVVSMQDKSAMPIVFECYRKHYDDEWEKAVMLTNAILAEMKSEAEAMGADFVAMLANAPEEVDPRFWKRMQRQYPVLQSPEYDVNSPEDHMLAVLAANDIPALDLRPAFRKEIAEHKVLLHYPVNGHWNPKGHRLAAQELARFLAELGLPPQEYRATPQ